MLTHGFEFEVWSRADDIIEILSEGGWTNCDELHGYHCDCDDCRVLPWIERLYNADGDGVDIERLPMPLHAQTDSSCGGEFISQVLDDFDETSEIAYALTSAVRRTRAEINANCGLHVHVSSCGTSSVIGFQRTRLVSTWMPLAYLAIERYMCELIAPGSSRNKREMNMTLLQRLRWWLGDDPYVLRERLLSSDGERTRVLREAITSDRHTDLNYSSRNGTWEFRVFNSTHTAWRVDLAVRLSVALVEHSDELRATLADVTDDEWYSIAKGSRYATMRPRITFREFVDIVSSGDPTLHKLIERQATFMQAKYRSSLEPIESADEEQIAAPRRRDTDNPFDAVAGDVVVFFDDGDGELTARMAPSTIRWPELTTEGLCSYRSRLLALLNEEEVSS